MKFFTKENLRFLSIILLWVAAGIFMLTYFIFLTKQRMNLDVLSRSLVILPVVTALIGIWHVKALFDPPKEKSKWIAAILGVSILPPIIGHMFFDIKALFYIALGGIAPVLTVGIVFPGLLVFIFAIVVWRFFPYPPTKKWQTPLVFCLCSVLWEISLITGFVLGNA